jgi:hypothetical protein
MAQVEVYTSAEGGAHTARAEEAIPAGSAAGAAARAVADVVVAGTAIGPAWHGARHRRDGWAVDGSRAQDGGSVQAAATVQSGGFTRLPAPVRRSSAPRSPSPRRSSATRSPHGDGGSARVASCWLMRASELGVSSPASNPTAWCGTPTTTLLSTSTSSLVRWASRPRHSLSAVADTHGGRGPLCTMWSLCCSGWSEMQVHLYKRPRSLSQPFIAPRAPQPTPLCMQPYGLFISVGPTSVNQNVPRFHARLSEKNCLARDTKGPFDTSQKRPARPARAISTCLIWKP